MVLSDSIFFLNFKILNGYFLFLFANQIIFRYKTHSC